MSPTARKRALLVGINRYPNLAPRYQLDGCVNDVELMRSILLEVAGFEAGDVTMLRDEEATRDAILAAFDALVDATGEGDIVVIHYSGHGSQMTDREGDEPDGRDETIVPSDAGRAPKPNRDITDDEIYLRLVRLGERTRNVTLVFDCCHSGTITRDAFGAKARWLEPDLRPEEQLPPSPVPQNLFGGATRGGFRDAGPSGWLPPGERYVLIAGCRDEELSYEHRARRGDEIVAHGALTYFLCEELRAAIAGTTYRDVYERVSSRVTAASPSQHPQMEGALDRELFGVRDLAPMRYVRVTARSADRVTLAAGAAHGMAPGSRWAVHPEGARRAELGAALGEVQITAVRAVASDARVVQEASPGTIVVGARAFEAERTFGAPRLEVEVVGGEGTAERQELEKQLGASTIVAPAAAGRPADVRIYLLAPRDQVDPGTPVPQLGALTDPVWAAVGEDGRLVMPTRPPTDVDTIVEGLERIARYHYVLALTAPDDSPLRGRVTIDLLRQGADGGWVTATPDGSSQLPVFQDGERVAARVTNRYDRALFVSILDLGLSGAVTPIHPVAGAQEMLAPGASIDVGTRHGGVELTLGFPPGYPPDPPAHGGTVEGVETFKLFATTAPTSFQFLAQPGAYKNAEQVRSFGDPPLATVLRTALGQPQTRDIKVAMPVADEVWTTIERPFLLRATGTPAPRGPAAEAGFAPRRERPAGPPEREATI